MGARSGVVQWARLAPTLVVCLVLVGCGGGDASDDPGDTVRSSGTSVSGQTAPGASLAVGEAATLPLSDGDDVIELTVTAIEQGDPQALTSLEGTPYYVRLVAIALDGDAYQFFVPNYLRAWAGDTSVAGIASPLTVGPCERTYFPYGVAPGATLETCLTFVVEPGGPALDRVGFENGEDYRISDETDVDWS